VAIPSGYSESSTDFFSIDLEIPVFFCYTQLRKIILHARFSTLIIPELSLKSHIIGNRRKCDKNYYKMRNWLFLFGNTNTGSAFIFSKIAYFC